MFIEEMIELESFNGTKVISGEKSLCKTIGDVTVMEVPDISDFVKSDDFLLTTLYPVSKSEEEQKNLIVTLSEQGCSGIGIKLNRYVNKLPNQMIEIAKKLDFPILILPDKSNFSVMIEDFLKRRTKIQNDKLTFRDSLHNKLMEIMLSAQDYEKLCEELYSILKKDVILLDENFSVLSYFSASNREEYLDLTEFKVSKMRELVEPRHYRFDDYSIYPIFRANPTVSKSRVVGYIALNNEGDNELQELEKIAIEGFALVFQIILQNKLAIIQMEKHYFNEFVNDILLREIDEIKGIELRAKSLGLNIKTPISIIVMQVDNFPEKYPDRSVLLEVLGKNMPKSFKEKIVFANVERYIVGFINRTDQNNFEKDIKLFANVIDDLGILEYSIGISQKVTDMLEYSQAYEDAKKTLTIARWSGNNQIMFAEEMGVYKIIYGCQNKDELLEFSNLNLSKVILYDKKNNADLLKTLSVFIEYGGNLKEAADSLFIHYNTARYRIRLLSSLTEKNFKRFDHLWDLNLALKIYQVLGKNTKNDL